MPPRRAKKDLPVPDEPPPPTPGDAGIALSNLIQLVEDRGDDHGNGASLENATARVLLDINILLKEIAIVEKTRAELIRNKASNLKKLELLLLSQPPKTAAVLAALSPNVGDFDSAAQVAGWASREALKAALTAAAETMDAAIDARALDSASEIDRGGEGFADAGGDGA